MRVFVIIFITIFLSVSFRLSAQGGASNSPVIERVSIDTATGNIIIQWDDSQTQDAVKYVIYEGQGSSDVPVAFPVDTISAPATSYTHLRQGPVDHAIPYTIEAIYPDDTSPLATYHYTIYLTGNYDSCKSRIIITWTPYSAWGKNLLSYNVLYRTGTDGYTKILSISPETTQYIIQDVQQNSDYTILVEAENRYYPSSSSNLIDISTLRAAPPSFINADYASVSADGDITLSFTFDPNTQLHDFKLLMGNTPDEVVIDIADFSNVHSENITYTHDVIFSDRKKNFYRLASIDMCPEQHVVKVSNLASNIVLQATEDDYMVSLTWDDYCEYLAGIKYYRIYRITDGSTTLVVDSVSNGNNDYQDNIGLLINDELIISDKICYYIEAEENDDNIHNIKGFSKSNTVCISATPKLYMPNAFTPDDNGVNDEIRPVITFKPEKYLFTVFDRWGSKVFETTDPDSSWDGRVMGSKKAPEGVYLYFVKMTTSGKILIEKRGTITLFYP